jgi:hypothetical protein
MLRVCLGLVTLLVLGLPGIGRADDAVLDGKWYGEDALQLDGTRADWLGEFRTDGSYEMEYRFFRGCDLMKRSLHEGHWKLQDGVWATEAAFVNGLPSSVQARYTMQELTAKTMRYKSLRSENTFDAMRVPAGFQFPRCQPAAS